MLTPPIEHHSSPHLVAGICVCGCEFCATLSGQCICLECPECERRAIGDGLKTLAAIVAAIDCIIAALASCEWCGATFDGQPLCHHPTPD